ncbi:beta-glucanase [Grosmannia clavigera kw1407]|uniref:lytic cellulose monooxygenase (C4-dehydrogenating) n=1 Tax=Grosmannia clavigera (strain kw1407 / UAMH 11150) TaxID=655863 RepID=F0XF41_GROCL|nr:beta-glucanase [Grosmannia clavigera kw1407]EFX04021.1 beta-glucanase [Grosmannia clavigera kw1407]
MFNNAILSIVAGAATVSAHGFVSNVVINGVKYAGYDVTVNPYESSPPTVIGWSTTATDLGYVAPDAYASSDIICHRGAENALGHAQVAAGDDVFLQWNTWPESHHGPVLSYLAACGDTGCETVEKTSLEFFKIDEKGLIDGTAAPGTYATDQMMDNSDGWMVHIPTSIAPGFYVLRHEIIALHSAGNSDGAQNYPQCFNLEVTGSGTDQPAGVKGTALYSETDAGILVNIYATTSTYAIPGPTMYSGASEIATQTTSAITATSSATTGTGLASAAATKAATSSAAVAAAAAATTSKASSPAAATTLSTAVVAASASTVAAAAPTVATAATSSAAAVLTAAATTALSACPAPTTRTVYVTV